MDNFLAALAKDFSTMELQSFQKFCFDKAQRSCLKEKLQLIYEYLNWASAWPTWQSMRQESSKSAAKAGAFRLQGNAAFQSKRYREALNYYTESVAVAPVGSQELAFAYANRSAVLISISNHYECLLDINRALAENYPEAKKQKLKDRKNKCVAFLRKWIESAKFLPPVPQYRSVVRDMKELAKTFDPDCTDLPPLVPLPKVDWKNKMIPNASDKINLKKTKDNKISVVATANIKPGEILAFEKPVAWNLSVEFNRTHCAYCFVRTEALIHCPNCSVVMFCSTPCRDNAFKLFHRIECEIFCKFTWDHISGLLPGWITVRLLLVVTKQGEKLNQIMNHPAYKLPLAKTFSYNLKEKFNSQDLSSIFYHSRLPYDKSLNDFSDGFQLPMFRIVLFWLYYLKQSTFFGDQKGGNPNINNPLTEQELYVATLLLRLSQTTYQFVKEGLKVMPGPGQGITYLPAGHGLFPLINIFSHSCEPHAYLYSYQNNLVCRSIRPIKAGEEIFLCYYHPYYRCPRYERIVKLQHDYKFECICRPCQHNWPTADLLPHGFPKVLVDNVGAKKFQEYSSRLRKLSERFDLDELAASETFKFLCEYLLILDRRFEKPCREFIECERLLDLSMSLEGNFYNII